MPRPLRQRGSRTAFGLAGLGTLAALMMGGCTTERARVLAPRLKAEPVLRPPAGPLVKATIAGFAARAEACLEPALTASLGRPVLKSDRQDKKRLASLRGRWQRELSGCLTGDGYGGHPILDIASVQSWLAVKDCKGFVSAAFGGAACLALPAAAEASGFATALPPPPRKPPRRKRARRARPHPTSGLSRLINVALTRGRGVSRLIPMAPRAIGIGGLGLSGGGVLGASGLLVTGGLPRGAIQAVVILHRAEVQACYRSGRAQRPNLRGRLKVSFTITPTGRVGRVAVTSSTLNHAPTRRCILTALRRWRFPRPQGSMPFVTLPFDLHP